MRFAMFYRRAVEDAGPYIFNYLLLRHTEAPERKLRGFYVF